jgi:glycerol-3-phosphate dehydrogenase
LAQTVLGGATVPEDLGTHFGAGLTTCEVDYMSRHEWARDPADVLWRRSKLGLHLSESQRQAVAQYLRARPPEEPERPG